MVIFQELNCKDYCLISLLQYQIYYSQYVGKSKTIFDLPLNNHRKDSKVKKNHFRLQALPDMYLYILTRHRIYAYGKKDQLEKKTSCNRSIMTYSIETRTIYILKLKSLHADGLNQEFNDV